MTWKSSGDGLLHSPRGPGGLAGGPRSRPVRPRAQPGYSVTPLRFVTDDKASPVWHCGVEAGAQSVPCGSMRYVSPGRGEGVAVRVRVHRSYIEPPRPSGPVWVARGKQLAATKTKVDLRRASAKASPLPASGGPFTRNAART